MSNYILNDKFSIYKNIDNELGRVINNQASAGTTTVHFKSKCSDFNPNLKHVYLEFNRKNHKYLSEHSPTWKLDTPKLFFTTDDATIRLPDISVDITEIQEFEKQNKSFYFLGINDCRHHVCKILKFCYPV